MTILLCIVSSSFYRLHFSARRYRPRYCLSRKYVNFDNCATSKDPQRTHVPNFSEIEQSTAELYLRQFQDWKIWGRPPVTSLGGDHPGWHHPGGDTQMKKIVAEFTQKKHWTQRRHLGGLGSTDPQGLWSVRILHSPQAQMALLVARHCALYCFVVIQFMLSCTMAK